MGGRFASARTALARSRACLRRTRTAACTRLLRLPRSQSGMGGSRRCWWAGDSDGGEWRRAVYQQYEIKVLQRTPCFALSAQR